MMALLSTWIAAVSLLLSVTMLVYRPAMTDLVVTIDLWGCCLSMCLAGLVLWSYRKEREPEPGIVLQRLQCKIAIGICILAAVIVYVLVAFAQRVETPGL